MLTRFHSLSTTALLFPVDPEVKMMNAGPVGSSAMGRPSAGGRAYRSIARLCEGASGIVTVKPVFPFCSIQTVIFKFVPRLSRTCSWDCRGSKRTAVTPAARSPRSIRAEDMVLSGCIAAAAPALRPIRRRQVPICSAKARTVRASNQRPPLPNRGRSGALTASSSRYRRTPFSETRIPTPPPFFLHA